MRIELGAELARKAFATSTADASERRERIWLLDSAAFPSMTPFESDFESDTLRQLARPVLVEAAGGHSIRATHVGTALIETTVDGQPQTVTVEDVLLVPSLVFRLLSTSTFDGTYGCYLEQWQGDSDAKT